MSPEQCRRHAAEMRVLVTELLEAVAKEIAPSYSEPYAYLGSRATIVRIAARLERFTIDEDNVDNVVGTWNGNGEPGITGGGVPT